jgi:hypothetical protein
MCGTAEDPSSFAVFGFCRKKYFSKSQLDLERWFERDIDDVVPFIIKNVGANMIGPISDLGGLWWFDAGAVVFNTSGGAAPVARFTAPHAGRCSVTASLTASQEEHDPGGLASALTADGTAMSPTLITDRFSAACKSRAVRSNPLPVDCGLALEQVRLVIDCLQW